MGTIVSEVIDKLSRGGIRSAEAYPGKRIPALGTPVAAVHLGKVDRSVRTTHLEVIIMSPVASGGSACELAALQAIEILQAMGGTCVKAVCKFDEMASVFYINIDVAFFGTALPTSWSAGPGYSIKIGAQDLKYVTSFQAKREVDDMTPTINEARWDFTMEELYPPGTNEPPDPPAPFDLTISRSGGEETYNGCHWVSVKREDTIRGVSQIRVGKAISRSDLGIL